MRPQRQPLIAYRSSVVTKDTAKALRNLEANIASKMAGVRIIYGGPPKTSAQWEPWDGGGPLGGPPHLSMRPTGREVYLDLQLPDEDEMNPQAANETKLAILWGFAVPLGFTPWTRYPIPTVNDQVFHFLGPWQGLLDHLSSEGRGDVAWAAVCAAAQSDVGTWMGSNRVERFVQAQLHRLGLHCGPVDGLIGERTASALKALGLKGTLADMARALSKFQEPPPVKQERRTGHVIIPGDDVNLLTYGKVAAMKINQGYTLTIDGPGRAVLNIGDEV